MTPQQKSLLSASFDILASDPEASAALFYAHLFAQDPSLRPMFTDSMKKQGQKFMEMMSALVVCVDRLDSIVPLLWQMGKRHRGYGVTEAHYAMACKAFLRTLEERSTAPLPPEMRAAWEELFTFIARIMQQSGEEGSIERPHPHPPEAPFPTV
jgi:hemoglobin-like flavoprotein